MQTKNQIYDVAVAGGGLAGLASSILLARAGHKVVLLEKNHYPFHRVCGEYISEESRPFLVSLGLAFGELKLPEIRRLVVTAPDGSKLETALDPGGFGISRFLLDATLASLARSAGVVLMEGTRVTDIYSEDGLMKIRLPLQVITSKVAVGSYGKRSNLDLKWNRDFVRQKPCKLNNLLGVKYHIRTDLPADTISLHNFKDGYCGVSRIENDLYCLCYLTNANNLGLSNNSIRLMEERILGRNPVLDQLLRSAERTWPEPVSISQVSFAAKSQVEDHVLMVGDAAGMITPLCGNGMSMALHGSKLLAEQVTAFLSGRIPRQEMENNYQRNWRLQFGSRLRAGRMIQRFFGDPLLTKLLITAGRNSPSLTQWLIRQTRGEQF
ncbi:NAD(P)/FAD-dependent oxidoreductase [Flavihumibacter stibioxidans]|uniref:Pyridine nucleotide-disulfide oxidoreductase n=1 Tax=Flavihumibacter stibioxidans TaxID=1834163 RepID=A0ABR7M6V7_9BACT|nr:NAD(P)/FAD-dependent oxidoreductase [Flavihumibacter stibioxidans]MBC6490775.1 pyridine nucleotide-disulfide oxidoreductase [Flavihumibacter stibioxidans]